MNDKNEEFIGTECLFCKRPINVPLSYKCVNCPHCGEHYKFDARRIHEHYKLIMKQVYGDKPANVENN